MRYCHSRPVFSVLTAVGAVAALVSAGCHDDPTAVPDIDQSPLLQTVVVTDVVPLDLSPLGVSESEAISINEAGQIVGWGLGKPGEIAFLWENGGASDLGSLGGTRTFARAINENGWVVGDGLTSDGAVHAILWGDAGASDLGTLGGRNSDAYGVNDAAHVQVVGESEVKEGVTHAFLWTSPEGMQDIHIDVCGGSDCKCSIAFDINDAGQIVGTNQRAFLWEEGSDVVILPGLEDEAYGVAFGINEAGQIVGVSQTSGKTGLEQHAVMWDRGDAGYVVRDLGTGAWDNSVAFGINEAGQIVGRGSNRSLVRACLGPVQVVEPVVYRPLLWYDESVLDLGTLEGTGDAEAVALNDAGSVVGWSTDGVNATAVRWSIEVRPATPEEATEELVSEIGSIVAAGEISEGNGNALLKKLDAITRKLNEGKIVPATNLFEAFVSQVEAYVRAGILTESQGGLLIQLARDAIEMLSP